MTGTFWEGTVAWFWALPCWRVRLEALASTMKESVAGGQATP